MRLKNRQIVEAAMVLEQWNPSVTFKTKMRLSRNLQRLQAAVQTYEWDKNRLQLGVVGDKGYRPEPGKPIQLSASELEALHPDHDRLVNEVQDVELALVPLYDGSEGGEILDPGIDISKVALPNEVLSRLLDIVLCEPS